MAENCTQEIRRTRFPDAVSGKKKELLELYNALNDSAYNSPEDLG